MSARAAAAPPALRASTYGEWMASLLGACLIAFGLGALAGAAWGWTYRLAPVLLLVGAAVHGWGMQSVQRRNRR